jgi:hypothetical protein
MNENNNIKTNRLKRVLFMKYIPSPVGHFSILNKNPKRKKSKFPG